MASRTFADIRQLIASFDPVQDVFAIDSVMTTFAPSQDYFNTVTTLIDNLSESTASAPDTINIVVTPIKSVDELTANWSRLWKERKTERHTYMLLQILWLGTPNEVASAMRALKQETGRDFTSVSQWEDWWQKRKPETIALSKE
jgi:hypothetical protein